MRVSRAAAWSLVGARGQAHTSNALLALTTALSGALAAGTAPEPWLCLHYRRLTCRKGQTPAWQPSPCSPTPSAQWMGPPAPTTWSHTEDTRVRPALSGLRDKVLPPTVSKQAGPKTRRGQAPQPTIQATRPPRMRAIPTVAPHQPGRSPVSPQGQGPSSPCSKALPTEEGSLPRDSRGLMTPQAEHQAASCCEVDGTEASWSGRKQWPQKGGGWAGASCSPRKPSHVSSQQRQPGNPRVSDPDAGDTAQSGCCPHVRPESPQMPLHLRNGATRPHALHPPSKRPRHWEGQRHCSRAPVGQEVKSPNCAPPMLHPHPTAYTVPLVGWPDARRAALHAEHVHSSLCGAEEPAEAQEGAHGHGRRRPPILGQSTGRVRAVLTSREQSGPLPGVGAPWGAKETPPEAWTQGSTAEGLRRQTTHCSPSQSPPDLCARPPTGTLMNPHRHSCLTSPTPGWQC